ncbi:Rrf2 family transcriptional regulator [Seleniivibrio sp.]|uniref:RrF2 family transcriptional regulator n=1 Tax=Seleniivibrio sp. TaxID=2898801 RepID=UPI0025D6D1AD|nr:Rrf2 family transcriptional regulator [Seleniivibrio sp.]MCD8554640.1 Rrf2 family transcriptional regulator [Seleniivibrio sp.]
MRISKKTEYAVHSLLYITFFKDRTVLLDELAAQGISREYLAKVMRLLTKSGILKSSVGVNGGYVLARPADQITLEDIFNAVEGDAYYRCESKSRRCGLAGKCGLTEAFGAARKMFLSELRKCKMSDMMEKSVSDGSWLKNLNPVV